MLTLPIAGTLNSGLVTAAVLMTKVLVFTSKLTVTGRVRVMLVRAVMVTLLATTGKLWAVVARIAFGWGGLSVTGPAKVILIGKVSEMSALVALIIPLFFTVIVYVTRWPNVGSLLSTALVRVKAGKFAPDFVKTKTLKFLPVISFAAIRPGPMGCTGFKPVIGSVKGVPW